MKVFLGSKRQMFMTSGGVQLDKYGRYVVDYTCKVKLYGFELFGMFIGILRQDE
jgi:hypothetical protein